jgi:hypothetical protein
MDTDDKTKGTLSLEDQPEATETSIRQAGGFLGDKGKFELKISKAEVDRALDGIRVATEVEERYQEFQKRDREISLKIRGIQDPGQKGQSPASNIANNIMSGLRRPSSRAAGKNKRGFDPLVGAPIANDEAPSAAGGSDPAGGLKLENRNNPQNPNVPGRQDPSPGQSAPLAQRAQNPQEQENKSPHDPNQIRPVELPAVGGQAAVEANNKLDAEIKGVIAAANLALDAELMVGVTWVWAMSLPSFGAAVFLGAVVGDLLWAFKNSIIKKILIPLLHSDTLKQKEDEIAKEIKISRKVKLNILAMNGVILLLIFSFFLFLVTVLYAACSSSLSLPFRLTTDFGSVCKVLNETSVVSSFNNALNRVGTGASNIFTGPISTAEVREKISSAAARNGVPVCVLTVIVQKESGGRTTAVGHNSHLSSSDPPNFNNLQTLDLDWNYSHDVGVSQWNISARDADVWRDPETPSRNVFGQWYTLADFLNPDVALGLTARRMSEHTSRYGIREAFRRYNGSGPKAEAYADSALALYNQCVAQGL